MKALIVTASINTLENVKAFNSALADHKCKVVVVDEGDASVRRRNDKLLSNIPHEYYGPYERKEWFKKRFGSAHGKFASVIPTKCHAETSFGFLVSYEEPPDLIIEIDDDVFPFERQMLVDAHARNLLGENGVTVQSKGKWYNTIENMKLANDSKLFPRGHPYGLPARTVDYNWRTTGGRCALNMGLWAGCPDFDALTILYNGGMNGQCSIAGTGCKRDKAIVERGTYFAVCSMNTAFLPEVVPAFYQLYSNFLGIDRFDDIWSGIFIKKIADHLQRKMCLGTPVVEHRKRTRDTFKDLRKELEGMIINEKLWILVEEAEISGASYSDAYVSLTDKLTKKIPSAFADLTHRKFLYLQLAKMKLWLRVTDRLA